MSHAHRSATETSDWIDLAERAGDGLAVALLWSRSSGRVKITVAHLRSGSEAELHVPPADALTAFYHPFAYRAVESPPARPITAEPAAAA